MTNPTGIHIHEAAALSIGAWYADFTIRVRRGVVITHERYRVTDGVSLSPIHEAWMAQGRDDVNAALAEILQGASVSEPMKMSPREFWFFVAGWAARDQ